MKSMTGYGYRETAAGGYMIYLEVKSYNNRYLDIQVNLPLHYGALEPAVREKIAGTVERGRVEVACRVREIEEDIQVIVDSRNARVYAKALRDLAESAGIPPEVHLGHLIRMEGIIKFEKNRDIENFRSVLMPLLDEVTAEFDESRRKEGERTLAYLVDQLDRVEGSFETIRSNAGNLERLLSEHLRERCAEIVEGAVDESRIAAEIAVLLMKYSIGEEIERFTGHMGNFRTLLTGQGGMSKKLDFICQELNREINTIASKSFILEINQAVVDIKDGIEKIREQLRNVE